MCTTYWWKFPRCEKAWDILLETHDRAKQHNLGMSSALQCCQCKKTFTTIDLRFLKQLPTCVVERFPFYTMKRGPGVHQSLVLQFISLLGTGVMYGSYCRAMNEVHRILYDMDQISYYDSIDEALQLDIGGSGRATFAPKVCTCIYIYS